MECGCAQNTAAAAPLSRDKSPQERAAGTEAARGRWLLLRQVLRQKELTSGTSGTSPQVKLASVRRFATFDLFHRRRLRSHDPKDASGDQWVEYTSVHSPQFSALVRDDLGPVKVQEVLNSFDNTGNVCVWPSEEVLAHYCLKNPHLFRGAVCELGGGMTCLAGIMVALCAEVEEVLLSDGNRTSVQNVAAILDRNRRTGKFGSTRVSSRLLRWDDQSDVSPLDGHFDVVMCADCLFLDQYRSSLVGALKRLLQPHGLALVLAPHRGPTLTQFCDLAQEAGLRVRVQQEYDAQVWEVHQKMRVEGKESYDENIHYPLLVTLSRDGAPAAV